MRPKSSYFEARLREILDGDEDRVRAHNALVSKSSKDPAYNCWRKMRNRCNNPLNADFRYYGALGIRVCREWDDFRRFRSDMGPRPSPKHSIDRIDPARGYELGNCRWATIEEQNRNKRSVRKFVVNGKPLIMKEFAALCGVDRSTVGRLVREGLNADEIRARFCR